MLSSNKKRSEKILDQFSEEELEDYLFQKESEEMEANKDGNEVDRFSSAALRQARARVNQRQSGVVSTTYCGYCGSPVTTQKHLEGGDN